MRLPDGKYKREIFHADPVDGRNHEDIRATKKTLLLSIILVV